MSSENIKTGLRLSEAIKLLEENEGALVRPSDYVCEYSFAPIDNWRLRISMTYDVKLPPPKTVTVTKEQLHKILDPLEYNLTALKDFEKFLKELGL
jgi:hypothetical protein